MDGSSADLLFRSLADRSRRDVLRLLGEAPLTVGEIAEVLGLPQSTVSRHLKTLRSTGLLLDRREGNRVYIGLTEPTSNGNGNESLGDILNAWVRTQPLDRNVQARLEQVMRGRNGGQDGFERLAHQWDELRFQHFGGLFHLEALASLLPSDWRVLDIGTGTGYLLPFLSRLFREVIAVDPSPAMLGLARERAQREGLGNVRFRSGRLESLPVSDESIDCLLAILVLRHSPCPRQAFQEAARALRPHGRLLAVDIGPHSMEDFQREMHDSSQGIDPAQLQTEVEECGFQVVAQRELPFPAPGHPAAPSRPSPSLFLLVAERSSDHSDAERNHPSNENRT